MIHHSQSSVENCGTFCQKTSLDSFKNSLTKLLLQVQDHPPVPGIASENSLLSLLVSDRSTWGIPTNVGGRADSEEADSEDDDSEDGPVMARAE